MKADQVIDEQVLLTAAQVADQATVEGRKKMVTVDGRRHLAIETNALVTLRPPRSDLSPMNVLVIHLKLARPMEGSLLTRFHYSTRAPGMAANDIRFSVLHFNQPRPWRGWQRIVIPAENLVATGFPDGWKDVESIVLDFHSRQDRGTVIIGDIELLQVRRPRGPRMSDRELLEALDLDRPELKTVARHAARGATERAIVAYASYLRKAKLPPVRGPMAYPHWHPSMAEEICRHLILQQQLPKKIDWQSNPIGYLEWNHAFNRHTWMGTLARAFAEAPAAGRGKYARKLDYFLRSWIEQNPEPVGHNGGLDPAWETLSTSCRINWSWPHVLEVAQRSPEFSDRTLVDMAKMVHAHAEHLLCYGGHCNWFISESAAILTCGAMFPEFRRAEHWMSTATRRLQKEMRTQVFSDGVQYELSPGYHTMCADLFYLAYKRAKFRGRQFAPSFRKRLWAMFDYLAAIARPDGTHPVMNDAGTALKRGNARLLEAGEAEKRPGWMWAGSGGTCGRPPTPGSVHFPEAGYAFMRSGWREEDRWAFIDLAEFGAAHQHEDKLQVELYAFGTTFLADPGISSYQSDPVVRYFRRSDSHNTINIDGTGQWRRRSGDYARYSSSSRGKNLWAAGRGLDFAQGCYDEDYGETERGLLSTTLRNTAGDKPIGGIVHTRALVFLRPDYWLILDSVAGRGTHQVEALWHFTPMHVRLAPKEATVRTNRLGQANLELICRGDWQQGKLRLVTGREKPAQGFIAIDDEVKPAPCAIVSRRMRLPLHGVTVAVPYATGSESHFRVTTGQVTNGRTRGTHIVVSRGDGTTDTFLWRHAGSGALSADGLKSNGRLALVRRDACGEVTYAALMDGRSLGAGKLSLKGRPGKLVEK
ncbi:MAG: hypothetical protein GWP05_00705 [Anaerolineaceae bacterium]|nr:hypothetical protein [Anaerolineaceae bacterium]